MLATSRRVLGIHLSSCYHEDVLSPHDKSSGKSSRTHVPDCEFDPHDLFELDEPVAQPDASLEARFRRVNIGHKGHLGLFVPSSKVLERLEDIGLKPEDAFTRSLKRRK